MTDSRNIKEMISELDYSSLLRLSDSLNQFWKDSESETYKKVLSKIKAIYPNLEKVVINYVDNTSLMQHFLIAIVEDNDGYETSSKYSTYIRDKIPEYYTAQAQAFDPKTISVIGVWIVLAILASRVSEIGSIKFYEGIPKPLVEILRTVKSIDE